MTPAGSDSPSGKSEWSSLPLFGSRKRDTRTGVSKLALGQALLLSSDSLPVYQGGRTTLGDRPSEPEDGQTGLEHPESAGGHCPQ